MNQIGDNHIQSKDASLIEGESMSDYMVGGSQT